MPCTSEEEEDDRKEMIMHLTTAISNVKADISHLTSLKIKDLTQDILKKYVPLITSSNPLGLTATDMTKQQADRWCDRIIHACGDSFPSPEYMTSLNLDIIDKYDATIADEEDTLSNAALQELYSHISSAATAANIKLSNSIRGKCANAALHLLRLKKKIRDSDVTTLASLRRALDGECDALVIGRNGTTDGGLLIRAFQQDMHKRFLTQHISTQHPSSTPKSVTMKLVASTSTVTPQMTPTRSPSMKKHKLSSGNNHPTDVVEVSPVLDNDDEMPSTSTSSTASNPNGRRKSSEKVKVTRKTTLRTRTSTRGNNKK